jgi:hypothetical protein
MSGRGRKPQTIKSNSPAIAETPPITYHTNSMYITNHTLPFLQLNKKESKSSEACNLHDLSTIDCPDTVIMDIDGKVKNHKEKG